MFDRDMSQGITRSLRVLSGGISQQPEFARFPNQFVDAENVAFSVVDGASARPGTWFERKISQASEALIVGARNKIHCITRDANEKYRLVLGRNGVDMRVRVFEVGGPEATITYKAGQEASIKASLNAGSPQGMDLRVLTIADGTIIANSKGATGLEASPSYAVTRVHKNANTMVNTTPVLNTYHQALLDGTDLEAGYYKYDSSEAEGRTFATFDAQGNRALLWNGWGSVTGRGNEWTSGTDARARFGFRRFPLTITGATAANVSGNTWTLTSTGAFTSYTYVAGDRIRITGGAGATFPGTATSGWATVLTRDSNNQITVEAAASTITCSPGLSVVLTASTVNVDGIGSEYEIAVNLAGAISTGDIQDMDDIAAELTKAFRNQGEADALVGWKPSTSGNGGNFVVTGPWAGSNATLYLPLPPITNPGNAGDMTMGGRPFEAVAGFSVITAGTSPGPGNAVATRVPIKDRWEITAPPSQPNYRPSPINMPVLLRRMTFSGNGTTPATFELQLIDWTARISGDEETNESPRMLQELHPIRDIAFHEQRLCLCGGPYVLMSSVNDVFNFYKEEDINLVDTDRIEIQVGDSSVPKVLRLSSLSRTLIAVTDSGTVYELTAEGAWSPTSVGVTPGPRYNLLDVAPVVLDGRMYLAAKRFHGAKKQPTTQIIEYNYEDFRAKNVGFDTTLHVPTLLNSEVISMAGLISDGPVLFARAGEPRVAYTFQTVFNGPNRVQAAWGYVKLNVDDRIVDMDSSPDGVVFLVETANDDILIETMSWDRDYANVLLALIGEFPYLPCMDRMQVLTGTWDGSTYTNYNIGYDDVDGYSAVATDGSVFALTRTGVGTYRVLGNKTIGPAGPRQIVGRTYQVSMQPSKQTVRNRENDPDPRRDILVRTMSMEVYRSGPFTVSLVMEATFTYTHTFSPSPEFLSRGKTFTVYGAGFADRTVVTITKNDPRPMNIQTITIDGEYADSFPRN
jgi:hypothetical protein